MPAFGAGFAPFLGVAFVAFLAGNPSKAQLFDPIRFVRFRGFHKCQDSNLDMLRQFRPGGHETGQVGVVFGRLVVWIGQGAVRALYTLAGSARLIPALPHQGPGTNGPTSQNPPVTEGA